MERTMTENLAVNQTAKDLIYLVSCGVNDEKPDLQRCLKMDLHEICKSAHRHSLVGMAALVLEQVKALPADFIEEKFKVIRRMSLYDLEIPKVLDALEKNKIWYLPLKGTLIRKLYPQLQMREMGDCDILCDPSRAADIRKLMKSMGYRCVKFDKIHHDIYEKDPFTFELHRRLFNKYSNRAFYDYYNNVKEKLLKDADSDCGYHFSNEDFYIYIICHLYGHYKSAGTGLRSLLDIYVIRKHYDSIFDKDYLSGEFEKLGLSDFERDISSLAIKVFTGQPLSADEQKELSYFLDSSTQGSFNNALRRKLENDDSIKAKKRYILRRLFPPKEVVELHYPIVHRHKILYPFLVIYRPFTLFSKKGKRINTELKMVLKYKKTESNGKYTLK